MKILFYKLETMFSTKYVLNRVRWGEMGMWGEMRSLLIFELQKKAKKSKKKK